MLALCRIKITEAPEGIPEAFGMSGTVDEYGLVVQTDDVHFTGGVFLDGLGFYYLSGFRLEALPTGDNIILGDN